MTPEAYRQAKEALGGRPPKIVVHEGRTAYDLEGLDFIAQLEGLTPTEASVSPAPVEEERDASRETVIDAKAEIVVAQPDPASTGEAPSNDQGVESHDEDAKPEPTVDEPAKADPTKDDLDGMTVPELKGQALALGIPPAHLKAAELKDAIRAKRIEAE